MEIFGPLLISTLAGLSTVLGGCIVFFKIKKSEEFISFCLAFSLSVMITISVVDLIPSSFVTISNRVGVVGAILICTLIFVLSTFAINYFNKKLDEVKAHENNNLYKLGILSMVVLALHNFPEGIATFMTSYSDLSLGISLGIAIMMHNIPEGISIAVPLFYSTGKRGKGIIHCLLSGLAEPLGAIVAYIFLKDYINEVTISYVLMFVAGIMITLAINNIFPESVKYNKKGSINAGLITGALLILINHYLF